MARLQVIHGIPFSYQPPPRTVVPHAAGLRGQGRSTPCFAFRLKVLLFAAAWLPITDMHRFTLPADVILLPCRIRAACGGGSGRMRLPPHGTAATEAAARILADVKNTLSAKHSNKAAANAAVMHLPVPGAMKHPNTGPGAHLIKVGSRLRLH